MRQVFNLEEVFDMAIQMEKNGAEFYMTAVKNSEDENIKQFLSELAAMEVEHKKQFTRMKSEIMTASDTENYYDPDGDAALYLKSYIDGHVFESGGGVGSLLKGDESLKDILQIAIKLEQDSVVFYMSLKDVIIKNFDNDKFNQIIKEELKHIWDLTIKYGKY